MSLYFYCQDVGMAQFTHAYESQIELAGANPDKFVFGLQEFYTRMASKIRKEDLYDLFFEFYYRCTKEYPLSEIGNYISVSGTELLSARCYSQGERLRNENLI